MVDFKDSKDSTITTKLDDKLKLKEDDITNLEELSEGGEGEVLTGKYKGLEIVLKKYKQANKEDLTEIKAYTKLEHPHMVKFYGYFYDSENKLNIVLERARGEELQEFFEEDEDDSEFYLNYEQKLQVVVLICEILTYLRKQHVIHRDLNQKI